MSHTSCRVWSEKYVLCTLVCVLTHQLCWRQHGWWRAGIAGAAGCARERLWVWWAPFFSWSWKRGRPGALGHVHKVAVLAG